MVKDNQKELKAQVERMFPLQKDCQKDQTVDSAHGRVEIRACQVITDLTFMDETEQWNSLRSVVQITSERDEIFNEDSSLKKKDHSAINFNMIVKVALALLERERTFKASKNGKRTKAALDNCYRQKILKC